MMDPCESLDDLSSGGGKGTPSLALSFIADISRDIFTGSLLTYLVLLTLEKIWRGFVSMFFEADTLLYIILPAGFLYVFTQPFSRPVRKDRWTHSLLGAAAALATGATAGSLIYIATAEMRFRVVVSICGGLLAALFVWAAANGDGGRR